MDYSPFCLWVVKWTSGPPMSNPSTLPLSQALVACLIVVCLSQYRISELVTHQPIHIYIYVLLHFALSCDSEVDPATRVR